MGKNNPLRGTTPERRNYKLYKAKKQWFTACATFLIAFGAMAIDNNAKAAKPVSGQVETTTVTGTKGSNAATVPPASSSAANGNNDAKSSAASAAAVAHESAAPSTASATTSAVSSVASSVASSSATVSSNAPSAAASSTAANSPATSAASLATSSVASSASTSSVASSAASSAPTSSATSAVATSSAASTTGEKSATSSAATSSAATTRLTLDKVTSSAKSGSSSEAIDASLVKSESGIPTARSAEPATVTFNYVNDLTNDPVSTATATADSAGHYSYTAAAPSGYILLNRAQTTYSGAATSDQTITIRLRKTEQRHYNVIEVMPDGTQKTLLSLDTTIVQRRDRNGNLAWGALDVKTDGSADTNSGTHQAYMNQNSLVTATEPSGNNNQGHPYVETLSTDSTWYVLHPDTFSGYTVQLNNPANYTNGVGFGTNGNVFFDLFGGDDSYSSVLPSTNFIISYNPTNNVSVVTYRFVDDDTTGDSQVGTPVTVSGISGHTASVNLTVPTNYELANSSQSLPTSLMLPATNTTIDIHLKHQHQITTEHEVRTLTVKYVDGITGQSMSSELPGNTDAQDPQIQVFYSRTINKDLVTGVTTGDWSWDQTAGDGGEAHNLDARGYHIIRGQWGHKTTNGGAGGNWASGLSHDDETILAIKVPDFAGYTAVTHGDWEKATGNPGTEGVSNAVIGADEYTWPGWSTDVYTDSARYYEARPVHTIYYFKNQTGSQTTTAHFTKWESGAAAGSAASDAVIDTYYHNQIDADGHSESFDVNDTPFTTNNGSTNKNDWQATYPNNWQWDTSKGDPATPGFHVVSQTTDTQWSGINGTSAHPASGSYSVSVPTVSGYTAVTTRVNGTSTTTFANPASSANSAFTQPYQDGETASQSSTTYYVPDTDLTHTITRTINVTDPDTGAVSTTTQTVTFNRTARVRNDNSGVDFGAHINGDTSTFADGANNWSSVTDQNGTRNNATGTDSLTGTWAAFAVPEKQGYTALIQTDGGATSAGNSVGEDTAINPDSKDSTVNVTYIKNAADITINHAAVTQIFNDHSATVPDNITHSITADGDPDHHLSLPTDTVSLDSDDFSWEQVSADGRTTTVLNGAPTDVGNYRIVLNDTGLQKFRNLSSNFAWNYDAATSYVEYDITPATAKATIAGHAEMTYKGSPATTANVNSGTIRVTLAFPGVSDANNTYTLTDGDYTWNTSDGHAPTNVGNYTITLSNAGLTKIQNAINGIVGAGNVTIGAANLSGTAGFDINQATATVTFSNGNQNVNYNGQANQFNPADFTPVIRTDNGQSISVPSTAHLSAADGDFAFTFTSDRRTITTEPTEVGTYTVSLTQHGLDKLKAGNDTTNYKWVDSTSGTYAIAKTDHVTVTLRGGSRGDL